jgi:hypothetical protein
MPTVMVFVAFSCLLFFFAPYHQDSLHAFSSERSNIPEGTFGIGPLLYYTPHYALRDVWSDADSWVAKALVVLVFAGLLLPAACVFELRRSAVPLGGGTRWRLVLQGLYGVLAAPALSLALAMPHMMFGFGGSASKGEVTPMFYFIAAYVLASGLVAIWIAVFPATAVVLKRVFGRT